MDGKTRAYLLLVNGTEREVPFEVAHPASAGKITVQMRVPGITPARGWRIEADGMTATGEYNAAPGDTITAVIDGQRASTGQSYVPRPDELLGAARARGLDKYERLSAFTELDEHLSAGGQLPAAWAAAAHAGVNAQLLGDMAPDDLRELLRIVALDYGQAKIQIARMRAELDQHHTERVVLLCLSRDLLTAQQASRGERDGTILRCTDTGSEWVLTSGHWDRVL